jgi:hypothetical protein
MASLRMTLVRPRPGASGEAQRLLEDLDELLAGSPGLVFSFVTQVETNALIRLAIWRSKEAANREATREHVLSLRSRLRFLAADTEEVLMEVKSGHVPKELTALLAGDLDVDASAQDLLTTEVT